MLTASNLRLLAILAAAVGVALILARGAREAAASVGSGTVGDIVQQGLAIYREQKAHGRP